MRVLLVLIALGWSSARADTPLPDKTERLITLSRVWAQAKFFHPAIHTRDIDWDAALVAAIPRVEAAKTQAELNAAVQSMLAVIGDPVTRVLDSSPTEAVAPADWLVAANGVVEVKMVVFGVGSFDGFGAREKAKQVVAEAAKAKAMIIDLRGAVSKTWMVTYAHELFEDALPGFDDWPLTRALEHRGYRSQDGKSGGIYYSTFAVAGPRPPKPAPKAGPAHVVFVADATATVPVHALALQSAGKATIVAQGKLTEDAIVDVAKVPLGNGATAQIRLNELVAGSPKADVTVAAGQDPMAKARALAKALVKKLPAKRARTKPRELPPLRVRNDDDYASTPYPSRERRLLAGIRLWAVLDQFFPYRYLIADWDAVLREMLPRLDAAADRDSYLRVVREMAVRAGDGHISVNPTDPDAREKARAEAPFETRLIEKQLTIIRAIDAAAMSKLGIAVGDAIETIDGQPVAAALADRRLITSGSTAEARDQRTAANVLLGVDGTQVKVGARSPGGKLREIAITRSASYAAAQPPSTTPHWKKLAGNIGYVDLRELLVSEVPAAMKELEGTKAMVIDIRGYPRGTAWALAPRLNSRRAKYGTHLSVPLVVGLPEDNDLSDTRMSYLQKLPHLEPGATVYRGKVVVLIDDRAISNSEHTCLFFQEGAGATFVGSATHGANGNVTYMPLPGGLRMSFTGLEVRHVDGKQLQQVGITPHIVVRPTLAGFRAGRDEVLDRALDFVAKGR